MEKRDDTSETTIGMTVLIMNLEKIMPVLLFFFFLRREMTDRTTPSRLVFYEMNNNLPEMAA